MVHKEAVAHFTGELILARDLRRYRLDRDGKLKIVMGRLSQQ
jgi:hypothetical protein